MSARSLTGISTSSKFASTSSRVFKALKDYKKLVNLGLFTQSLEDWVSGHLYADSADAKQSFKSPFSTDELHKLDLALEGVLFQQLCCMPFSLYASDDSEEGKCFAIEDFLHAVANGLWRTFRRKSGLKFFYF